MAKGEKIRIRVPVKKIITTVVVISLGVGTAYGVKKYNDNKKAATNAQEIVLHQVERGNVSLTITGSSAVEPYDRREVIAKVSGDITYCPYEVGQTVTEGAVVYQFDTSDKSISIQKQQLSLENSQRSYEKALEEEKKLSIKANASGVISNLSVKVGDDVKANTKIADISDTVYLEVVLPFSQAQAASISVGDSAYVSSSLHMSNVSGTVTHKAATAHAGADGSTLVDITISFKNEGSFAAGLTVGGSVGDAISPGSGVVTVSDSGSASAEVEGTVSKVYYSNGDYVKKGDVIATITSDTITDNIRTSRSNYESAKLNLQEANDSLDDYTHTAQISGVVIAKNAKEGDTIDKTNSSEPLMVIADISKLKFDLEIDELDVSKVAVGQVVEITCDALPDEKFRGEITYIPEEGTTLNGVTTYAAEVVISEPGNLRSSMNIDASVVVESSENTLMIPSEDVKSFGNIYYVYRKINDGQNEEADNTEAETMSGGEGMPQGERPEGMPEGMTPPDGEGMPQGERPEGMEMPEGMTPPDGEGMPQGERPEGMEMPQGGMNEISEEMKNRLPSAPEGFEIVIVTVGVIGNDYTEILSGLSEGDEVYAQTGAGASGGQMPDMGGGMGGMSGMGGGMGGMSGGMGGGAPGGGMR